jgi:WD40 repeat protein/serine/threonine protein kinase
LVGESAKRIETLELPEAEGARLPRPERVYVESNAGRPTGVPVLRALHPLVHYESIAGDIFFLNARRGKQGIEYLSYDSGATLRREDLGTEHRALLAEILGQPVAVEAADAWATASLAEEPTGDGQIAEGAGRTIGEFELLSRLGQGGMGVVYRAWQPSLGRQVALKCMLRAGDAKAEARFAREIRALARVEHPNVVKVFTSGSEGDQWFYAMELIEGAELSRVCDHLAGSSATEIDEGQWRRALTTACEQARSQEASLSTSSDQPRRPAPQAPAPRPAVPLSGRGHVSQVVDIVRQVADAVHTLHEAGVVHRDIKPGNIMLTTDGGHPVLMDLGLAQLADESDGRLTRTRQFVGTLRYASPEQVLAAGRVDRRTDVYSLGATLWELLTLRPIFGAGEDTPTPELMLKIQTTDPEAPRKFNPRVPRDLEAIVLKCLEKDRERRYATAADLSQDLGRFLHGEPVTAQPPSLGYLTNKFVRRYRVPLATATGILLLIIAGTVAAFINIDQERRATLRANQDLQEQQGETAKALATSEANGQLAQKRLDQFEKEAYANRIAVAERELFLNADINLASDLLTHCPSRLQGWEWRYLMRLRDGARPPLSAHTGPVWSAVFSPDGKLLASASVDGTVKLWDVATGTHRTFTGHFLQFLNKALPVVSVSFSPDGRWCASGSLQPNLLDLRKSKGVVKIWETNTLKEVGEFDEHLGLVSCVVFSPDGNLLASASLDPQNTFLVWEARTRKRIAIGKGHTGMVNQLRFSPDGQLLVSASTDGTLKFWSTTDYQLLRTIEAHSALIHDVAFTPDGKRLVSVGMDGTTKIWDRATGQHVMTFRGHTGSALGVAVSPDGKHIATAGFDNTVRLWDAHTGEEKITLRGHTETVWSVAFSPDGQKLASASFDSTVRIWDASPPDEQTGLALYELAGHDDRVSTPAAAKGPDDRVNNLAFSRDGKYLATGGWDATIHLWDTQTRKVLRSFRGHKTVVWGVAFSPDADRLASASWDGTIRVWEVATGRELLSCPHATSVHCVAFSPNGNQLASGGWDGLVKIWDARTGKELASCNRHLFPAMCVAFSPDGKRLASGSGDHTASIWDVSTGKELLRCEGHTAAVPWVAFSPDGSRLVSAGWDKTVRVWDVTEGRSASLFGLALGEAPKARQAFPALTGHTDRVHSVAFSPDGKLIASGSDDKCVRVWEASTGKEALPPLFHRGWVWSVAFSPDNQRLAAANWSTSGRVKVWRIPTKAERD